MKFKLKPKTKKAIRGSITVLLVIILLPMMTFSAVIVDSSRINMAKEMMSSAGDLTMNTALANYDTILKDVYGLFAMSQEKTEAELAEELKNYFAETISGYGVIPKQEAGDYVEELLGDFKVLLADSEEYENDTISDLLKLENLQFSADRVDSSALANSSVLRNQIVEYMKFRAPLTFGMSFIDALKSFEVADDQMDVVEVQVKAQEGTEDVAKACSKLINLIREYDDLVKDIDSGTKAVKGLANSTDGINIPIKDYDTQIDKYLSNWGENYTHINKLLMVFLAKSPSVNDIYLVKQDYINGVYFIKSDNTGVVYDNSGINVPVTVSGDTAGAKTQVTNQIAHLDTLKSKATVYEGKSFINDTYVNQERTAFTNGNEDNAIKAFIEYEKFLKDENADIKYTDVVEVLNQIYILAKYYDNFYAKIGSEISVALENLQAAQGILAQIQGTINGIYTTLSGYVTGVNDTSYGFAGDEPDFTFLKNSGYKGSAESLLSKELPAISGGYQAYYDTHFASGSTNKYLKLYKDVATKLKSSGSAAEKAVATAALDYVNNNVSKGLSTYFDEQVKNLAYKAITGELRNFFICLMTNSGYADNFKQGIADYEEAKAQEQSAIADVNEKQGIYDGKVGERDGVKGSYETCLGNFKNFVKAYQKDAYYYGSYITTATNIVNRETGAVSKQFGDIVGNINSLTQKLNSINTQCGEVKKQIEAYKTKLDNWEKENNEYISANGSDSFSKQTAEDIATARSNYNLDSLATLQTFVQELYNRYNGFYTYLQGDVYFKYGGLRLHEIKNTENAKTAAKNNIASISASVITTEIANTSLGQLYKGGKGTEFRPYTMEMVRAAETVANVASADTAGQLCFLEPVTIQIQFLKYLNSSYQESKPVVKEGETDPEADYEKTEEDLKKPDKSIDDMGKEEPEETKPAENKDSGKDSEKDKNNKDSGDKKTETVKTDKYGYSYKNIKLSDTDKNARPSKDKVESSSADNTAFALDSESEKASSSVDTQGGALDSVLSGIGSAVTAGLENAYILTYLFENFSYNTMIQDAVMEGEKSELGDSALSNLTKAKGLLKGDTLAKYKDAQESLSGIQKRAANNYLYGAEIEYILFGNTSPSKNVSSMKASIYAIRFCFNCIYAFTNTEIRNTTMAAGLAVQAATLGIVPYQVVQIVLQLALAAAESAVDLDMMMSGLDVAVVKTKDTWMLSVTSAVKATGEYVAQTAADYAGKAINSVAGGLQNVLDVSADKLSGAIEDVQNDISEAAEQAVRDTVDSAFAVVTNKIEAVLNDMQYAELNTKETAKSWISEKLTAAKTEIESELNTRFGSSDIGSKVLEHIKSGKYIDSIVNQVKTSVDTAIDSAPTPSQAVEKVMEQLTTIKMNMVNTVTSSVNQIIGQAAVFAKDSVDAVKTELQGYIAQAGKDLSEEASKQIREGVTNATNKFVDETLSKIDTTVDGGSGGSSLAAMFKFGYKEYLMLFVYIGICAGGTSENNKILLRTADVIQFNINHAGEGAAFTHSKKDKFRMKNACTYISINAEAELDMFFMNLDIFSSVVEDDIVDENSEVTTETEKTGTKIRYKGLLGY